jgi:hypothetical protein
MQRSQSYLCGNDSPAVVGKFVFQALSRWERADQFSDH